MACVLPQNTQVFGGVRTSVGEFMSFYFDYQFDFVWWCVLIVAACECGGWVAGSAACATSLQWSPLQDGRAPPPAGACEALRAAVHAAPGPRVPACRRHRLPPRLLRAAALRQLPAALSQQSRPELAGGVDPAIAAWQPLASVFQP